MLASQVSAVVCTYNSISNIERCLLSLKENGVGEIIVVDGGSTDGTKEIALIYADQVLKDPFQGLAIARNIGIRNSSKKYILNVGSDNYFPQDFLKNALNFFVSNEFGGISFLTSLNSNAGFLSFCLNEYRRVRFKPGITQVIGTPTLFKADLLKSNLYSSLNTHSDDEELCRRLSLVNNSKFYIAPIKCFEADINSIDVIKDKWTRYGISDFEVYRDNYRQWGLFRRIKSLLHPMTNDFIIPLFSRYGFIMLPFLVYITVLRYLSWIKTSMNYDK